LKVKLAKFCSSASLYATIEPLNVTVGTRPDLSIPDLHPDGKTYLVDVTTADASRPRYLNKGSHKKYFIAAETSETGKTQKYAGTFNPETCDFIPAALETSGRWSKNFHRLFNKIKKFAHQNRVQDDVRHSLYVQRWRQILCVSYSTSLMISAESTMKDLMGISQDDVAA
jgi:hypothetical protein